MPHRIIFASSSEWKRSQVRTFLAQCGIEMADPATVQSGYGMELQASTIEEVCEYKALTAARQQQAAVIVDDTGFFVDALNGFPGPYAKYVNVTLGPAGLLELMRCVHERTARIASCVGYSEPYAPTRLFMHEMTGRVAQAQAASPSTSWADMLFFSVFIPEGHHRTLGEMAPADIMKLPDYPLRNAVEKFARWFATRSG